MLGRHALPAGRRAPENLSPNFELGTLAREKTVVFATLGTITAAVYFGTLHVPLFAAPVLAPTAVDAAIPFVPLFVVPYLSLFLLVLLPLCDFGPASTVGRCVRLRDDRGDIGPGVSVLADRDSLF